VPLSAEAGFQRRHGLRIGSLWLQANALVDQLVSGGEALQPGGTPAPRKYVPGKGFVSP